MNQAVSALAYVSPLTFPKDRLSWVLINFFYFHPLCFFQLIFAFLLGVPFSVSFQLKFLSSASSLPWTIFALSGLLH